MRYGIPIAGRNGRTGSQLLRGPRSCTLCHQTGHNARTCGRASRYKPAGGRTPAPTSPADDAYEIGGETAVGILAGLRDLLPLAATRPADEFLPSLMLSCYLRGLLVGDVRGPA